MIGVLDTHLPGVEAFTLSHTHQVHVSVIAWDPTEERDEDEDHVEVFDVDINPYLYERGAGYTWTKIPGVQFTPNFVHIQADYMLPQDIEALKEGWD